MFVGAKGSLHYDLYTAVSICVSGDLTFFQGRGKVALRTNFLWRLILFILAEEAPVTNTSS